MVSTPYIFLYFPLYYFISYFIVYSHDEAHWFCVSPNIVAYSDVRSFLKAKHKANYRLVDMYSQNVNGRVFLTKNGSYRFSPLQY